MTLVKRPAMLAFVTLCCAGVRAAENPKPTRPVLPDIAPYTVEVASSKDGSKQKALFFCPENARRGSSGPPAPLLVALHTWSNDYKNAASYLPEARRRNWVLIGPDFRGPNSRPQACASDLAVQDILDAVEFARLHAHVDGSRIYLLGGSGGGHMSLIMAGRAPNVWAAVSSWCPITDLAAWHKETFAARRNYWKMLEQSCGGPPGPETLKEYRARSPLTWLAAAKGLPLDINTGIHDGHTGSVPVSHALNAFNVVAVANGESGQALSDAQITEMCQTRKVPGGLASEKQDDPERRKAIHFRRLAGSVRVTVFEGGHEQETSAACEWLSRQKKGAPANFQIGKAIGGEGAQEVPR